MRTLKSFFLPIIFSLLVLSGYAQKQVDNPLKTAIQEMADHDLYETSRTVGFAGTVSKQYQRFQQLLSLATERQLVELAAEHKNAVVRLYAFQALKKRKAVIPGGLFEQFMNDRTRVTTLNGCVGDKKTVGDLATQDLRF
jgi:hypothetical protein